MLRQETLYFTNMAKRADVFRCNLRFLKKTMDEFGKQNEPGIVRILQNIGA
jgi:hypothetical protein